MLTGAVAGRRQQGGAISLVLLSIASLIVAGGAAAVRSAASLSASTRAVTAADGAAHAAVATLATDRSRDQLSVAIQAGRTDCSASAPPAGTDLTAACTEVRRAAEQVAGADGGHVTRIVVSPDLRDRFPYAGAGRLTVLVAVAVWRGLPVVTRFCHAPGEGDDLCWAVAWSAAQEAG